MAVDMNYRFVWDTEPTDEQLLTIMKEVEEDVRRQQKKNKKMVIENIKKAVVQARKLYHPTV